MGSVPDKKKSSRLIHEYYQPTNGFVVQNLSSQTLDLPPENIKIFAYGNEDDYKTYKHTNDKCYYQLDLEHYYEVDTAAITSNFTYFTSYNYVLEEISNLLSQIPNCPILLFLDDHGDQGYFSSLSYLFLYYVIMQHQTNKFLIFNDSCFSGSFVDIVYWYNRIHEINNSKGNREICTIALFSFFNLFKSIFQFQGQNTDKAFKIAHEIIRFFQNKVKIPDTSTFEVLFDTARDYFQKSYNHSLDLSKEFTVSSKDYNKVILKNSGISNLQELLYFYQVVTSLHQEQMINLYSFQKCRVFFTEDNLDLFIDFSDNNFDSFYNTLKIFNRYNGVSFDLPPHPNIEIISSTDSKSYSLAFSSIRTNEFTKVQPGSPAMGAFIKEVFMNQESDQINFSNIENEITKHNGNDIDYPYRLPQENGKIRRKWIQLKPQQCISGTPIKSISKKDILGKISVLRTLTYSVSNQLKQYAERLAPKAKFDAEQTHDMFADIVSVAAVLHFAQINEFAKDPCLPSYNKLGFESLRFFVETAMKISGNPIKLTAVAVNYLQKVTHNDFSIMAQLKKEAYGFALLIAGILIKEKPAKELIQKLNYELTKPRDNFNVFLEELEKTGDDDLLIRVNAECHLSALCVSASGYIDTESRASGIAHALYQIDQKDETVSALQTLITISKLASEAETKQTEEVLMKSVNGALPIAQLDSSLSTAVLAEMPAKTAIYALLIATQYQLQRVYDIFKVPALSDTKLLNVVNAILNNITSNRMSRTVIQDAIVKDADSAAGKVKSTVEMIEKETRMNTGKRIPSGVSDRIDAAINKINTVDTEKLHQITKFLKASSDKLNSLKSQLTFLDFENGDPLGSLGSIINTDEIFERAAKEMLYVAELLNISDPKLKKAIAERAKDINEASINSVLERTMLARSIGVVEIVPITKLVNENYQLFLTKPETVKPNFDEIMALISGVKHILHKKDKTRKRFRQQNASACEYDDDDYYSPNYVDDEDGPPHRSTPQKTLKEFSFNTPQNEFTTLPESPQTPSPQTPSPQTPSPQTPSPQTPSPQTPSPQASPTSSPKEDDDRIEIPKGLKFPKFDYTKEIPEDWLPAERAILEISNLRRRGYHEEAWRAFKRRFNVRLEHLGIKFDPEEKYVFNGLSSVYDEVYGDVALFFPITLMNEMKKQEANLNAFFGIHMDIKMKVKKAFIQAFDDVDRILTPIYYKKKTLSERTPYIRRMMYD